MVWISIDDRLTRAEVAINNARSNADILSRLDEYMYNLERINAGSDCRL
jgi:hypothetical protein